MTDAAPPAVAPATDMETQPDAPAPTMSLEEQALEAIRSGSVRNSAFDPACAFSLLNIACNLAFPL